VETSLTGLALTLSGDWKDLPAGAEVIAGEVGAAADTSVARSLVPAAKPTAAPKPKPKPGASGGDTGGGSGGSSTGSDAGSSGTSGAGAGGSGSGSTPNYDPGPMPAPQAVDLGQLLRFLGAVFPIKSKYRYSDDFGVVMTSGEHHTGIDIFALERTPLVAVQDGTIEQLRWRSLGGNSLHLVDDRGDYFYYAHLDHYAAGITNGTRVTAGEVIGYVGNTGNARHTAPHCHFEVHPAGGGPVDPYAYLEEWRGAKPIQLVRADGATAPGEQTPSGVASLTPEQRASRDPSLAFRSSVRQRRDERRSSPDGGMAPLAASLGVGGGLVTALVARRRTPGPAGLLPPLDSPPMALPSGPGS
jgi:murein DD-endopeptidase MepM/ murein hydrolase activator NlpD